MMSDNPFLFEIIVGRNAIDANGHVNNVEFVRWMQEAAVAHADAIGCTAATISAGATWFVRSHWVEYVRPAFFDESITIQTWVATCSRAHSLRKYRFVRANDGKEIARGETDWVFVDARTGRPRAIPAEVVETLETPSHE